MNPTMRPKRQRVSSEVNQACTRWRFGLVSCTVREHLPYQGDMYEYVNSVLYAAV